VGKEKIQKKAVIERINTLLDLAQISARNGRTELASREVKLARVYSAKSKVKMSLRIKRRFCRKCNTPLIPGLTETVRIRRGVKIRHCVICGWYRRYPVK